MSVGGGCEGSVAAGWRLDGKQRQGTSLMQNLGLSTRADVLGKTYCLASNRVLGGNHPPFGAPFVSVLGLNWASED